VSADTIAATTLHKVFNETPAQAYTILFASQISKLGSTKQTTNASQSNVNPTSNAFEALAHIVEEEPEFESCASDLWQTETPMPTETSTITDDSVGDVIALHKYVLEPQNTVETIKTIWKSVADGEIPLALAGFLTNVVLIYLFEWIASHSPCAGHRDGMLYRFFNTKDGPPDPKERFVHSWMDDTDEWKRSSQGEGFLEHTHGYGLLWPIIEMRRFEALVKAKGDSLTTVERCRFENYFKAQPEQRVLRNELIDSVPDCVSTSETRTKDEHQQELDAIIDKRYQHDRDLVQPMCGSIHQHPLWDGVVDFKQYAATDWHKQMYPEDYLQFTLGVPLLWNLKACLDPDSTPQTTLTMSAHISVESCRSFISQNPAGAPPRTNNGIKVLSFARNNRIALQKFLQNNTDPVRALPLHPNSYDKLKKTIKQLDRFTCEEVFDLYSQSPWVTGSYLATIAARNMMLGLGLMGAQGYISDLLHLYNMLQKLRVPCPKIPLLEHLYDILGPMVFPHMQGRPLKDFDNMPRVGRHAPILRKNGKWTSDGEVKLKERLMKMDNDLKNNMANLSDFASETLVRQSFFDRRLLAKILDERLLAKKHNIIPSIIARFTPSDVVLRVKDHIMPEFNETFPLAKVDYFALMNLVLDVWKEVASQLAKPDGLPRRAQGFVGLAKADGASGRSDLQSNTLETVIGFLGGR